MHIINIYIYIYTLHITSLTQKNIKTSYNELRKN